MLSNLSCGTLIHYNYVVYGLAIYLKLVLYLLTSEKRYAIPVKHIHSNFTPSCQIDRGHIKVPQNKLFFLH